MSSQFTGPATFSRAFYISDRTNFQTGKKLTNRQRDLIHSPNQYATDYQVTRIARKYLGIDKNSYDKFKFTATKNEFVFHTLEDDGSVIESYTLVKDSSGAWTAKSDNGAIAIDDADQGAITEDVIDIILRIKAAAHHVFSDSPDSPDGDKAGQSSKANGGGTTVVVNNQGHCCCQHGGDFGVDPMLQQLLSQVRDLQRRLQQDPDDEEAQEELDEVQSQLNVFSHEDEDSLPEVSVQRHFGDFSPSYHLHPVNEEDGDGDYYRSSLHGQFPPHSHQTGSLVDQDDSLEVFGSSQLQHPSLSVLHDRVHDHSSHFGHSSSSSSSSFSVGSPILEKSAIIGKATQAANSVARANTAIQRQHQIKITRGREQSFRANFDLLFSALNFDGQNLSAKPISNSSTDTGLGLNGRPLIVGADSQVTIDAYPQNATAKAKAEARTRFHGQIANDAYFQALQDVRYFLRANRYDPNNTQAFEQMWTRREGRFNQLLTSCQNFSRQANTLIEEIERGEKVEDDGDAELDFSDKYNQLATLICSDTHLSKVGRIRAARMILNDYIDQTDQQADPEIVQVQNQLQHLETELRKLFESVSTRIPGWIHAEAYKPLPVRQAGLFPK